jgi:prolipoprotein diacylglyceryltransferase
MSFFGAVICMTLAVILFDLHKQRDGSLLEALVLASLTGFFACWAIRILVS